MTHFSTDMTSKERLSNAISGSRTDRPPVIIPGGMMAGTLYEFLADRQLPYPQIHTQVRPMVAYAQLLQRRCGLDNFGVPFFMTVEAEAFGAKVDMGTPRKEPRIVSYPARTIEAVSALTLHYRDRVDVILAAVSHLTGKDVPVIGNMIGPVSLLTSALDAMYAYRAFEKNPEAVHFALNHLADIHPPRGMDVLKPNLSQSMEKNIGKFVISVVEGDTHDIGKNIVSIMLTSAGFTVFDLGRDVPAHRFIEAAERHHADFICLSSLMSATVDGMVEVIQMLQSNGARQRYKVVIGGGAVSSAYAKKIGADGYATNAVKAVQALKTFCIYDRQSENKCNPTTHG